MENLIEKSFYLIVLLVEFGVVLLIVDAIMRVIGAMIGFSWKKFLISLSTVFGLLWLRDFIKGRKNAREEGSEESKDDIIDLTDDDFEQVE